MTRWAAVFAVSVIAISQQSAPACAHQLVPGVTGFPALMLHPLFLPHQLVCIVVAALLAGRTRPASVAPSIYAFGLGLVAAQWLRSSLPWILTHYWMALLIALVISAVIAALLERLIPPISIPLVAVLGVIVGLDTAGEGPTFSDTLQAVAATFLSATAIISALGWTLSRPWPRWVDILARVIAAWAAAAGVMVLAFALKT